MLALLAGIPYPGREEGHAGTLDVWRSSAGGATEASTRARSDLDSQNKSSCGFRSTYQADFQSAQKRGRSQHRNNMKEFRTTYSTTFSAEVSANQTAAGLPTGANKRHANGGQFCFLQFTHNVRKDRDITPVDINRSLRSHSVSRTPRTSTPRETSRSSRSASHSVPRPSHFTHADLTPSKHSTPRPRSATGDSSPVVTKAKTPESSPRKTKATATSPKSTSPVKSKKPVRPITQPVATSPAASTQKTLRKSKSPRTKQVVGNVESYHVMTQSKSKEIASSTKVSPTKRDNVPKTKSSLSNSPKKSPQKTAVKNNQATVNSKSVLSDTSDSAKSDEKRAIKTIQTQSSITEKIKEQVSEMDSLLNKYKQNCNEKFNATVTPHHEQPTPEPQENAQIKTAETASIKNNLIDIEVASATPVEEEIDKEIIISLQTEMIIKQDILNMSEGESQATDNQSNESLLSLSNEPKDVIRCLDNESDTETADAMASAPEVNIQPVSVKAENDLANTSIAINNLENDLHPATSCPNAMELAVEIETGDQAPITVSSDSIEPTNDLMSIEKVTDDKVKTDITNETSHPDQKESHDNEAQISIPAGSGENADVLNDLTKDEALAITPEVADSDNTTLSATNFGEANKSETSNISLPLSENESAAKISEQLDNIDVETSSQTKPQCTIAEHNSQIDKPEREKLDKNAKIVTALPSLETLNKSVDLSEIKNTDEFQTDINDTGVATSGSDDCRNGNIELDAENNLPSNVTAIDNQFDSNGNSAEISDVSGHNHLQNVLNGSANTTASFKSEAVSDTNFKTDDEPNHKTNEDNTTFQEQVILPEKNPSPQPESNKSNEHKQTSHAINTHNDAQTDFQKEPNEKEEAISEQYKTEDKNVIPATTNLLSNSCCDISQDEVTSYIQNVVNEATKILDEEEKNRTSINEEAAIPDGLTNVTGNIATDLDKNEEHCSDIVGSSATTEVMDRSSPDEIVLQAKNQTISTEQPSTNQQNNQNVVQSQHVIDATKAGNNSTENVANADPDNETDDEDLEALEAAIMAEEEALKALEKNADENHSSTIKTQENQKTAPDSNETQNSAPNTTSDAIQDSSNVKPKMTSVFSTSDDFESF